MGHPKTLYVIKKMIDQNVETTFPVLGKEGLVGILEFALARVQHPENSTDGPKFLDDEDRVEAQAFALIGTVMVWLDARFDIRSPVDEMSAELSDELNIKFIFERELDS